MKMSYVGQRFCCMCSSYDFSDIKVFEKNKTDS